MIILGLNKETKAEVTPIVERDETRAQLKVLVSQLRVRENYDTKANAIGYATQNGIYNDLEVYKDDNYT